MKRDAYFDPRLYWSAPWSDRWTDTGLERRLLGGDWQTVPDGEYTIDRSRPRKPVLVLRE